MKYLQRSATILLLIVAAIFAAAAAAPKYVIGLTNTPIQLRQSSQVRIVHYHIVNTNSSWEYVQVFDSGNAAGITLGTTLPTTWFGVPPNGLVDGAFPNNGILFQNGIVVAATTTANGSTAPSTALNLVLYTEE